MMDEKRGLNNELAEMKERVVLQHETKAAKTVAEQRKAEGMSAEMERDVGLPWL
jgi:hypothetical protein